MLNNAPRQRGADSFWTLGASADLVGEDGLDEEERKRVRKATDVLNLSTANGPTASTEEVELDVPNLGIKVKTRILGDSPDVLSMGIRCAEQGFEFYWDPFSYKPRTHHQMFLRKGGGTDGACCS